MKLIMWTVVIVAAVVDSSYKKKFNKIFDSELIAQGVSDLLNEVTYTHDLVYNNKVMADSKLFEESTSSGQENLKGEYRGLSVETIRVWIGCTNIIGKKQYFSGRIFKLENPQVMTGTVRLYTCEFPWKRPHIDGYMYVALTPGKLTQEKSMIHEEYYEKTLEFVRADTLDDGVW